ncbi:MAG: hypothetical protein LUQ31_06040 [Methanoregula sp.]|nr:hypothetical protein [Methanoregula sp.]
MKKQFLGCFLTVLMLAAIVMVPAGAAHADDMQDALSESLANGTTVYHGDVLRIVQWVDHPIDASKVNKPLTRDEFISINREYIQYLIETAGPEAAMADVNKYSPETAMDVTSVTGTISRLTAKPHILQKISGMGTVRVTGGDRIILVSDDGTRYVPQNPGEIHSSPGVRVYWEAVPTGSADQSLGIQVNILMIGEYVPPLNTAQVNLTRIW